MVMLALDHRCSAVNLLTGLGERARRYVVGESSSLGKKHADYRPAKTETKGGMPPDGESHPRSDPGGMVRLCAAFPGPEGRPADYWYGRTFNCRAPARESLILGSTAEFFRYANYTCVRVKALPELDWDVAAPVAVIGNQPKRSCLDRGRHWVSGSERISDVSASLASWKQRGGTGS